MLACLGPADAALIRARPPAGFEDLVGPQAALVDLYFLAESVGAVPATFRPGSLTFDDPDAVVGLLPGLAEPDRVRAALTGPLNAHAALVCGGRVRQGCGELAPEVAGVVFDSTRFRADIFVNPALLKPQALEGGRFLPAPEAGVSAVSTLAGAFAGGIGDGGDHTLTSRSILARDSRRLEAESSISGADGASLDVLAAEADRPGWRSRAGLYRTAALPLLGEHRLAGAGWTTSTDLRRDRDLVAGTPIMLFLPRRAHVEIRRAGRLLAARSYPPGNQVIDTRALPEGAYEIELRIVEANGTERIETQFFAKDGAVPPLDQPRWVLEAGLPAREGGGVGALAAVPLLHAGTTHRLTGPFALGADLALRSSDQALEVGTLYLHPLATFALSGFAAVSGDAGVALGAYGALARLSYGLSLRHLRAADGGHEDDPLDLDGNSGGRLGLTANYSLAHGRRIGLRASWAGDAYTLAPNLFWPVWTRDGSRLDLTAELALTDRETVATARLRYQLSRPQVFVSAERATTARSLGDLASAEGDSRVDAYWMDGDRIDGDLRLGGGAGREAGHNPLRAESAYSGALGRLGGQLEHRSGTDGGPRYAATGLVNLLGNGERLAWGGDEGLRSGVVIAVDGGGDAAFTILVDERPHGRVRVGERVALPLAEYELYEIRLQPIDAPRIAFDADARRVVLFPGTVHALRWEVQPLVVAFGRLVDATGAPLADARVEGGLEPGYTDGRGFFQLETPGIARLTVTRSGAAPCAAQLVAGPAEEELVAVGDVVCS